MPRKGFKYSRKTKKFSRKSTSASAIARTALREVNKLKAASGPHLKDFQDLDLFDAAGLGNIAFVEHLTAISAGDLESQRNGENINLRSVLVDGSINQASGIPSSTVHVALIQDKRQESDADPTYATVYSTDLTGAGGDGLTKVFRNSVNLARFRVLWSDVMVVDGDGYPGHTKYFRKFIKFNKTNKVVYNGANTNDIERNGLYFIGLCDTPSATIDVNAPIMSYTARVRYDP